MDKLSRPITVTMPEVAWNMVHMCLAFISEDLVEAGDSEDNNAKRTLDLLMPQLKAQGMFKSTFKDNNET